MELSEEGQFQLKSEGQKRTPSLITDLRVCSSSPGNINSSKRQPQNPCGMDSNRRVVIALLQRICVSREQGSYFPLYGHTTCHPLTREHEMNCTVREQGSRCGEDAGQNCSHHQVSVFTIRLHPQLLREGVCVCVWGWVRVCVVCVCGCVSAWLMSQSRQPQKTSRTFASSFFAVKNQRWTEPIPEHLWTR